MAKQKTSGGDTKETDKSYISTSNISTYERARFQERWAWVILGSSFILQGISVGVAFSVGVFYTEWLETFQETKSLTAWIGSLNTGLLFGAGPLASILTNRYSHRAVVVLGGIMSCAGMCGGAFAKNVFTLYLTYGVLAGVGACFVYVPSVVIVGHYFHKNRNLALGLSVAGVGVGCLISPPLLNLFVTLYGWRGGLFIAGGIALQSCVFGSLLRPIQFWEGPQTKDKEVSDIKTVFNFSLLKDISFIIILLNNILWNIGSLILIVLVTDYARISGINQNQRPWILSSVGVCSTIGRLFIAVAANKESCNRFVWFTSMTIISGIAICLYPVYQSFWSFLLYSILYGLCFGMQLGVLAIVTTDLFGLERLTSAYGYLMFGNGTGALLGPPIAGWLYDKTGSYTIPFFTGGLITIFSGIILFIIPIMKHFCHTPYPTDEIIVETYSQQKENSIEKKMNVV